MNEQVKKSIVDKLRTTGIPEFREGQFTTSEHLFQGSGRSTLTKGVFNADQSGRVTCVLKSLCRSYAVGNTNGKNSQEYKDKLLSYFEREADIWTRARDHPNIVGIMGFVACLGLEAFPALVFEFFPLGDLRSYVEDNEDELDLKLRFQLLRDVAVGLNHLHSLQPPIVHRDLCGANILVKRTPTQITACINDFGSAKLMDPAMKVVFKSTNRSSLAWQPPEYVKSKTFRESYTNPKPSGDIWSFGCVVLEVLTGEEPWPSGYDVIAQLEKGHHPPRPQDIDLSDDHWKFLEKCWRSAAKKRPGAEKLISKLDLFIYS